MPHTSPSRYSARRPFRISAVLAILLLLGLAGLRPPPAALASCGATTMVGDTDELNAAIAQYNDTLSTCTFSIQLENDIYLTADVTLIVNDSAGAAKLTINGAGFAIDGDYQYKTFSIENSTVTIEDLTIANGKFHGINIADGELRVARSDIKGNTTNGIWAIGSEVVVVDSLIRGNDNGIFTDSGTDLKVINTTVVENSTSGIVVTNGTTQLTHVTAAGNGDYGLAISSGTVTVDNSILAGNSFDCSNYLGAGIVDINHSLVQSGAGAYPCAIIGGTDGNLTGVSPRLSPLGDLGGPTPTMLLATGSPAIDAGSSALSLDENGVGLASDQRSDGYPRLAGVEVDMGATESSCADAMGVGNETELAIAINCFNGTAVTGPHWISFVDDISLTNSPPEINNSTTGPKLYLDGDGNTLDAVGEHDTINITETPDVTISNIFLENSADDAALDINSSNVMVWNSIIRGSLSDAIRIDDGELVVSSSTLAHNDGRAINAGDGGISDVTLINTTITGNGENSQWAIAAGNGDSLRLTHVTMVDNNGGLYVDDVSEAVINNSILARNEPDCQDFENSSTVDFNNSLVQTDDASYPCGVANDIDNNFTGHDPMLLPLGKYGGLTPTMPPYVLAGGYNYVIDTGNYALSVDQNSIPMSIDQRGFDRVVNGLVDMGAVEVSDPINCHALPEAVSTEHELNIAIFCYGAAFEPREYVINLADSIELTESTLPIDQPAVGFSLTIIGNSRAIDGQDIPGVRPLTIAPGTVVRLKEVMVMGGNVAGLGGGIYNEGYLTIEFGGATNNTAGEKGGGIFNAKDGGLSIYTAQISENTAGGIGGGIANEGNASIAYSLIGQNEATHESFAMGGGISNEGRMYLQNSLVISNHVESDEYAYAGGINNLANLIVRDTSIVSNLVESGSLAIGGGIYSTSEYDDVITDGFGADLKIINSTISSNTAEGAVGAAGGGLFVSDVLSGAGLTTPVPVTLINTTVAANAVTAPSETFGAGMAIQVAFPLNGMDVYIANSILSDNLVNGEHSANCQEAGNDALEFTSYASLYGFADDQACGLATGYPDANGNYVGVVSHLGPLAANGGPFPTHLPQAGSPAINTGHNGKAVDEGGYSLTADQRGYEPRDFGGTVDMGAVEAGASEPSGGGDLAPIYMTTTASGKTADGLSFDNSDILEWNGEEWTMFFDGSVALQAGKKSKHNINAFSLGDDGLIMSFAQNARKVPGITPKVDGADLVRWDGFAFSLVFDGSDVGLEKKGPEKIDGLHVLPGEAGWELFGEGTCVRYLMISTTGPGAVPAYGGTLKFGGEDVLGFCLTEEGETTDGYWHMLFDGSFEGVKKNAIDSISYDGENGILYLTTKAKFKVDDANGNHSSVYAYDIANGTFSGPVFKASDHGLPRKVNGLQVD